MNKEKLRYAILKELEAENKNFDLESMEVEKHDFDNQVRFLHREKYIDGVRYANDQVYSLYTTIVTEKGERYLKDNSALNKTYKGLKEIRDWLKL